MDLWPDIVVESPESPPQALLAVEVKAGATAAGIAETQLKSYMVRQSCPVGVLVTAEKTVFLRNRYTGVDGETVQEIGECRTRELLGIPPDHSALAESYLLQRVEQWLEGIQLGSRKSWPAGAQEAIESFVVPSVIGGVVRAAGPRWSRTGS